MAIKINKKKTTAIGLLLFDPYSASKHQIRIAGNRVADYFDAVDIKLKKSSVSGALGSPAGEVRASMTKLIRNAMTDGFITAAKHSGIKIPALHAHAVKEAAEKRAALVGKLMHKSSKHMLKQDSDFALSGDRAMRAAKYEASRAFFNGMKQGFKGSKVGWGKQWMLAVGHDVDDTCDDAEDDGVIPMGDVFANSFDFPPAHLNCECWLGVRRL